jgi:hypothetical protein
LFCFFEQDFDAQDYKGLAASIPAVKASKLPNHEENRGFCIRAAYLSRTLTFLQKKSPVS